MNPYRESAPPPTRPPCPSCGRPLDGIVDGNAPLTCAARCGAWYGGVLLPAPLVEVGEPDPIKPFANSMPPICPQCAQVLERRLASGVPFSICVTHGAWVPLDSMVRFEGRMERIVRERLAEERELADLAESFTTEDGRRAVAKRLLSLERRLAKLERR